MNICCVIAVVKHCKGIGKDGAKPQNSLSLLGKSYFQKELAMKKHKNNFVSG